MRKRVFAFLLTLCLLASLLPQTIIPARASNQLEKLVTEISIPKKTVVREVDGNWRGDQNGKWFHYDVAPSMMTLTFQDGTELCVTGGFISGWYEGFDLKIADPQTQDAPWELGTYTMEAELAGIKTTYTIEVVEASPLARVELLQPPTRTELRVGEADDFLGAVLRLHYTDGTYEDAPIQREISRIHYCISQRLNRTLFLDELVNQYSVSFGQTKTRGSKPQSISIRCDEQQRLTVTFHYADGTAEDLQVLGIERGLSGGDATSCTQDGLLITDKGNYAVFIYDNTTSDHDFRMTFYFGEESLASNAIATTGWLRSRIYINEFLSLIYGCCGEGAYYHGTVSADNLDDLIALAAEHSRGALYEEEVAGGRLIDCALIQEALSDMFGLKNVDVTRASAYDSDSGKIFIADNLESLLRKHQASTENDPFLMDVRFENGTWIARSDSYCGQEVELVLNANFEIQSYHIGHTEVVDPAKAPTCTEAGLSEGKHCSACNTVLVKQETVAALGHDFKGGVCTRCGEKAPAQAFPDVKESAWYYDAVMYATSHGIFKGNTDGTFGPSNPMNRAMLVTTLHRLAGEPAPKAAAAFSDVDAARYYAKPVAWAAENGIVNGMGNNKFQPNTNVTREQAATFLYRYAAYAQLDTTARADLSKFHDVGKVSNFAKDSLSWANAEGLINGKRNTQTGVISLDPKGSATRAELAKILMCFMENVVK